ncbi:heterokaryon incompatibility protein-domain-containing protein [Lasiosphaeria hispida]|uniref:Heterokaryon incompatibility protein-domain-containing protein n=1 Tax=Lasiosphaeria hispida TaxID=260671 RepID=A0AAJ0MFG1_9PEZI|nr:heterokaryon incompatibility protein-domain-containing protein [Lasiosphaeria hispida]
MHMPPSKIQAWLEECLEHHPKCLRPRTTTHPPHLLDLQNSNPDDTSPTADIRLAIRPIHRGHYAILSHCWGTSQPLRLLQSNLEVFQSRIPFVDLPKTFQDAVTTMRALGLRYLWSDSLCILQDSVSDWEEHCPEMANIYRRSYVTLAGPLASGCTSGFFHTRVPPADPAVELNDEGDPVSSVCRELDRLC